MSKTFSHGQPDSGMLVLQHTGFNKREAPGKPAFDLDLRGMISAVRVVGRHERGHWIIQEGSAGDVLGGALWESAGRSIPGWAFAWPVVGVRGTGNANVATGGAGQCAIAPDPMYLPMWADGNPDARFVKKKLNVPEAWGDIKFPENYVGISLMSTREDEQVDFFFPSDPRLIAVHHNGDVRMGTIVTDMAPDFKVDKERNARLQSIFRVIKNPLGEAANTIALNMTRSGCGDVFGGMFFDFSANPDKAGVIGTWNSAAGGPIVAGHPNKDKHIIGTDADGTVINQGHLWLRSKFYWNEVEDGPLKYDGIYEEPSREFPKPKVEIQQTPYQAGSYFQYDPNIGEFRWSGGTFIYNTSNITTKKAEKDASRDVATEQGQALETSSGPPGDRASGYGLTPVATGVQGNTPPPPPPPPSKTTTTATAPDIIQERTTGQLIPHMSGTLLRRPQMQGRTGFPDMGKWENQTSAKIEQYDKRTPVTYKTVPFGKQGGDSWDRKQVSPNSRYSGGTGLGGIAVIPPEADITDTYSGCDCFPPAQTASGKPISNASLLINTGTFISTGQADTSIGGVKLGHRTWGTCNGKQITEAIDSSGSSLLAGTGVWETGKLLLRWQGTEGCEETAICVDHKVTAPDTNNPYEWTFQARNGTIALQDGAALGNGTIPFINGGLLDDDGAMTYDDATGDLGVPGSITIGGTFSAPSFTGNTFVANSSMTTPLIYLGTTGSFNTLTDTGTGKTFTFPNLTGTIGMVQSSSDGALFFANSTTGDLGNDHLQLKWDASNQTLRINHDSATSWTVPGRGCLQVINNGQNQGAVWAVGAYGFTDAPEPSFIAATRSKTAGTSASQIRFDNANSAFEIEEWGSIYLWSEDVTDGAEYGKLDFQLMNNGTVNSVYTIDENADTHVWSLGGSELMRLDTTGLGIGGTASYRLDAQNNSDFPIRALRTSAGANVGMLRLENDANTVGTGGSVQYIMDNSVGTSTAYARQEVTIATNTAGSEDGRVVFGVMDGGTIRDNIEIAPANNKIRFNSGGVDLLQLVQNETLFNNGQADINFVVKSTGSAALIFGDGGGDVVGIKNSSPLAVLDVIGDARFGDSTTNYVGISSTGDVSFTGSSGFYPRVLSQAAEPAAGTGATQIDSGEMIFWVDTDDSNRVYQMYNNGGTVVKVELT